jgi:TatD DNase family protein
MTLSLEEAARVVPRRDRAVAWGVGCHPGDVNGQRDFSARDFADLIRHTPVVGEIGLDRKSPVPFEVQRETFRAILEIVADNPRLVSIHSNHATAEVLDELSSRRISVPVLHWWSGGRPRTRAAVEMGCFFSIHPRIAEYSIFRDLVPLERIFMETDHDHEKPPEQIPGILAAAEATVAAKYGVEPGAVRAAVWRNLGAIAGSLPSAPALPEMMGGFARGSG